MVFKIIEEALDYYQLGKLTGKYLNEAYGETSNGILVWLPQINDNEKWFNIVSPNGDFIVQICKKDIKINKENERWEPAVVITRDKQRNDFNRLPDRYRPVYRNSNIFLTIHAKENLPIAQGNMINNGNYSWIKGFANTVEEAIEKEKLFMKEAKLQ